MNPTAGLEIIARRDKPKRVVGPDVASEMIQSLRVDDQAIWGTVFYAGLRAGELQALRVEDVELFDGWGLLHVRQSWDKVEGAIAPKPKAGTRQVPIPEPLYKILDEHLLRLGRTDGLIFGRTATEPFSYNAVRDRQRSQDGLQLHEGRHSYSSMLAAAGIPKERRDRYLGHADHSMDGRYTHQLDPSYLDDAQTFSEYLRLADTPARVEMVRTSRAPVSTS
jgi:integrase